MLCRGLSRRSFQVEPIMPSLFTASVGMKLSGT